MPTDSKTPWGLQFFHPDTPASYRRNRLLFVGIMTLVALAIIWPVYPFFSGIYPLLLGFPLSFSWVILCLFISLIALVILYNLDASYSEDDEEHS